MTHVPPALSIVTPCYNGLPYLREMLASVRAQTFADWEHIVVDDGSTDGSLAYVEEVAAHEPRLRALRQNRGGVGAARRAGYAAASSSSRYVYFLDADDVLEPAMFETLVAYLDTHPSVGVAYCDYTCVDRHGRPADKTRMPRLIPAGLGARELADDEPATPLEAIYAWAPVMESMSMIRRSAYDATRGWDAMIGQPGEGVDLFTEIALRHEVHFVNVPLYRYRRHSEQASHDPARLRAQDLRVQLKWRDRRDLTPADRARIERAQQFRRWHLGLHHAAHSGRSYLRRGEFRHAAHCALEIGRTMIAMSLRRSPWPTDAATSGAMRLERSNA
jgi:glycosyltransferase involved in cell wall biosynthesis